MRPHPTPRYHAIEALESRIAPAAVIPTISADGKKATWTDVDGDKVTLAVSKGTLDATNIDLEDGPTQGAIFQKLDLSAAEFKGATVTLTAARDLVNGGNNEVNLGHLVAVDNTLGAVKINGDLAKLTVGLAAPVKNSPKAVASLTVNSMGEYGASTLDVSELGLLASEVTGVLGAVKVRGSITGISLSVVGGDFANIESLTLGGSLVGTDDSQSGSITTTGGIKAVTIKGHILGGKGQQSGTIEATGLIGKATILGSIIGGHSATEANDRSGFLQSDTGFGSVTLGGSLLGGTQQSSGVISTSGNVGSLTILGSVRGGDAGTLNGAVKIGGNLGALKIGGDIVGGAAQQSGYLELSGAVKGISLLGSLRGGSAVESGFITIGTDALDTTGAVTIVGDVKGGTAADTGVIETTGPIAAVTIKGSLLGGGGDGSGVVRGGGAIKSFTLGGSIIGGDLIAGAAQDLVESGYVEAAAIDKLTVVGSIVTGTDYNAGFDLVNSAAIRVENHLGAVTIKGSIEGNVDAVALITARGQMVLKQDALTDVAMGKVVIGGRVSHANILAGYDLTDDIDSADANPNAQIVAVAVGGDWIASNLLSGVALSPTLANGSDTLASGVDNPDIDATIGAIVIKGTVAGSATAGDRYGFLAQLITTFQMGAGASGKLLLNTNGGNDNSPIDPKYNLGSTGDTRLYELALT